jgi:hypothetical protein
MPIYIPSVIGVGGKPGGSNTQFQYKDGANFAGTSALTFNGSDVVLGSDLLFDLDGTRSIGSDAVRANAVWISGTSLHIGDSTVDTTVQFTNQLGSPIYAGGQVGLDDLTASGTYSGLDAATFEVQIDSIGGTDTFEWRKMEQLQDIS